LVLTSAKAMIWRSRIAERSRSPAGGSILQASLERVESSKSDVLGMRIEVRYRRIPWRLAFIRAGRERKSEHAREERRPTRSVRSPREQKGECRWARTKSSRREQRAAGFCIRRPPALPPTALRARFLPAAGRSLRSLHSPHLSLLKVNKKIIFFLCLGCTWSWWGQNYGIGYSDALRFGYLKSVS